MTVKIQCKDHTFELSEDMIVISNKGRMLRATCPVCGRSILIKWKDVADLLGMDVPSAKEYIKSKASEPEKKRPESDIPEEEYNPADDYYDNMSYEEEELIYGKPEKKKDQPKVERRKPSVEEVKRKIEEVAREIKEDEIEEEEEDIASPKEVRIKKSYLEEQAEKTSFDILLDVIKTSDIPQTAKNELSEFFSYRPPRADGMPNDWQPKEVKDFIVAYGISPTIAEKIANRYQFLLNNWMNVRGRINQMMGMLGSPGSFVQTGTPTGTPTVPGVNPYQPQAPPVPQNQPPVNPQQESIIQNMIMQYNLNPQAFLAWLSANPSYMPLWQIAVQRMQNPYQIPTPPINPMMGMGYPPTMMMGMGSQGFGAKSGVSRDEVRRMVSDELDKLKDSIKSIVEQNKGNETTAMMMGILAELVKSRDAEITSVLKQQQTKEPSNDITREMLSALLNHTLESSRGDPATQAVLEELKELKKSMSEDGGRYRGSSLEDFQKILEGMKLRHSIDMEWEKFKHEKESSERTKELIKKGIDEVVPVLAQVAMAIGQRGAPQSEMQTVSGVESTNTISLPCPDCGTMIVFPKNSTTVKCPRCGNVYDTVRTQPKDETPQGGVPSAGEGAGGGASSKQASINVVDDKQEWKDGGEDVPEEYYESEPPTTSSGGVI